MTPTDVTALIQKLLPHTWHRPIMLAGPPGIGKTDAPKAAAKAAGIPLVWCKPVFDDPGDVRGMPHVFAERSLPQGNMLTGWATPDHWPRVNGPGILLMDEFVHAPQLTQNAYAPLIYDRAIGHYHLPDGWLIVATGNRVEHRAAVHRMPTHIAGRFTHIDVEVNLDQWLAWAGQNGILPELMGFLRYRPDLLMAFDANVTVSPTPRGYHFLSDQMKVGLSDNEEFCVARGILGEGCATELLAFSRMARAMFQDLDEIIANPKKAKVPKSDKVDQLYAVTSGLAAKATKDNFAAIYTYAERLTAEFRSFLVLDAVNRDNSLRLTDTYVTFAKSLAGKL